MITEDNLPIISAFSTNYEHLYEWIPFCGCDFCKGVNVDF